MRADREKAARSVRIARGQLDGVLRMIEEDRYCVDISNQLMAAEAILRRVNQDILRAHIRAASGRAPQRRAQSEAGGSAPPAGKARFPERLTETAV